MRIALRAFGIYVGLIFAVVGGGFMNAAVGPIGVAIYGVLVGFLIVVLLLHWHRRGRAA